ncbi:hypothetical protein Tco_1401404 [Tanacetum coccineum]
MKYEGKWGGKGKGGRWKRGRRGWRGERRRREGESEEKREGRGNEEKDRKVVEEGKGEGKRGEGREASVKATSDSTVRPLALDVFAGCFFFAVLAAFAKVLSLLPYVGGVFDMSDLTCFFLTLTLGFGGLAHEAMA